MNVNRSKFRNIFAKPCPKDHCFTNLNNIDKSNAGDSAVISANETFFAVPWRTGGGGALLVYPRKGKVSRKVPNNPPIIYGHSAQIVDHIFCPFRDNFLLTASVIALVD